MPKIYGNLQRPKPSYEKLFRFGGSLLWLLAGASLVYAIWFSNWFKVQKVVVEGTHFSSATDIARLVPAGSNIWFISKNRLENQILGQPSTDSVAMLRGLPDSVKIVITEKKPALLWIAGDTATVLDERGIPFYQYSRAGIPTPDTDQGKILATVPRVYDVKALPVHLDQHQVASVVFIQFLNSLPPLMTALIPGQTFDHYEIAETTYDLTVVMKKGMRISLNSLGDPNVQLRNLNRLITQKNLKPDAQVDLRIDRWAYVH
jgi:hypothetical protein